MRAVLFRLAAADSVLDALDGNFQARYHILVDWKVPISIWASDWRIGWYEHEDRSWEEVVKEYHVPSIVVLGGPQESEAVKECDFPDALFERWLTHKQQTMDLSKDFVGFMNRV